MKGIQLAKKDLERGVILIRDKNYFAYCNGVTRYSLQFFHNLVKKRLLDVDKVYRADLHYSSRHNYFLTLHTVDGMRYAFHGMSFGYHGEGSRGSAEVLKTCGFSERSINKVFEFRDHHKARKDSRKLFKKRVL